MFNKKYIRNIDECMAESSTVSMLRTFANIYWRISTICCGILACSGFLVSIMAACSEDLTEVLSMLLFKMEADETGFSTFLLFFNTFIIYAAAVIFSGLLIKTLFNAGADLLYSSEVSAKIKILEYKETHPEEDGSEFKTNNKVVDNFVNKKPKTEVEYNPDAPFWCGNCGHPGPYEGACPKCYSGMKKFNV